jgi:hypothetical protein
MESNSPTFKENDSIELQLNIRSKRRGEQCANEADIFVTTPTHICTLTNSL